MIIFADMIGSIVGVYNGKTFNQVEIKPEMIAHYLAEFSISYKPVKHGRPAIGATHSSSLNFDNRRSKSCHVAKPKTEYHECTIKEAHAAVRPYANVALKFYNEHAQANYKLAEPGGMKSVGVVRGCIHHINFTAKKKDVADAPVEMFFAELTTAGIGIRRVTTCQCLGPEKYLSGNLDEFVLQRLKPKS